MTQSLLLVGNIEALVVAAGVIGDRELAHEVQRQVPISVPHQALYGCCLAVSFISLVASFGVYLAAGLARRRPQDERNDDGML